MRELRRETLAAAAIALACLPACGGSDDGGGAAKAAEAGPPTGKVILNFDLADSARTSTALVDPPKGHAYGRLYFTEDVGLTGPHDGATLGQSVDVVIDVTAGGPSKEVWTSAPMLVQHYTFLGFFDVDGNGATDRNPESGDPATLPTTNKFDVKANQTTQATVLFDLVLN